MAPGRPSSVPSHLTGPNRVPIEHSKLLGLQQNKVSKGGSQRLLETLHVERSFAVLHSHIRFRSSLAKIRRIGGLFLFRRHCEMQIDPSNRNNLLLRQHSRLFDHVGETEQLHTQT